MHLWIRFLVAYVRARSAERVDVRDETRLAFRVAPGEADARFLNGARYLHFCEVAQLDWLIRTGVYAVNRTRGWRTTVIAYWARYRSPLRRLEAFALRTRLLGWDDKWCYFEHTFEGARGRSATVLVQVGVIGAGGLVKPTTLAAALGLESQDLDAGPAVEAWRAAERVLLGRS